MKRSLVTVAGCVLFLSSAWAIDVSTAEDLATALSGTDPITLTADINLTGWSTVDVTGPLTLEGNEKKISGLTVPFLGAVTGGASIQNLTFEGCSVSATSGDIGLVAKTMKTGAYAIRNLAFKSCTLYKKNSGGAGFVVGSLETPTTAVIEGCTIDAECKVTAAAGAGAVGGMAGYFTANGDAAEATISACVNNGKFVLADWTMKAAGIVCNAKATKAKNTHLAYVNIFDCTNHASAVCKGANSNFGGIVQNAEGGTDSANGFVRIRRCANYGDITLTAAQNGIGGIVSTTRFGGVEITDCVNYGKITAAAKSVGGIAGCISEVIKDQVTITGCANLGALEGMDTGGIVGEFKRHTTGGYWVDLIVRSCFNRGTLTSHRDGFEPGEIIGYQSVAGVVRAFELSGSLGQSASLLGGAIAGVTYTTETRQDNVDASASEGLVGGADLTALNAFGENCNLWKQGTLMPILKIMPDEPAPDTVTVVFQDATDFASTVLKTCVITRGTQAFPPERPEHEGYTFLGWDVEDLSAFSADATVTAVYQSGLLEHTVRFFDYDGTQIGEDQTVEHGKAAVPPADPVRADYLFVGWSATFNAVESDLDVTAVYVALVQDLASGEDLGEILAQETHPEVTYRLAADIVLPADWSSVDFCAVLDGAGHTIRYAGTRPLFNRLTGTVKDFVLEGLVEAEGADPAPTAIANVGEDFALVATSCLGGRIAHVVVRNYQVSVSSSITGKTLGLICARAGDGATVEGCVVEASCAFRTRSCTLGAIVGAAAMSDVWLGEDPLLLTVSSCTNFADLVTISSGGGRLGGILSDCSIYSATRLPDVIVTNCVNRGNIKMDYPAGAEGRVGGIVAQRDANVPNGTLCGTLTIVDCANYGDIDCIGYGYNSQNKSTVCDYGGIFGFSYRLGAVTITRCQNRGRVAGTKAPNGNDLNGGVAGGIVGELRDVYTGRPVLIADCANYGDVGSGLAAGGLIGQASFNYDYQGLVITSTNSANYGAVAVGLEAGAAGEWVGMMDCTSKYPNAIQLGVWNSCFRADALVGLAGEGLVIHTEGNVVMSAEDYSCTTAVKTLSSWAKEFAFSPWGLGIRNKALYPELKIFREKPYLGMRVSIR